MKKAIITIIVGLLLVGCSNHEKNIVEEVTKTNKFIDNKEIVIKASKETEEKSEDIKKREEKKKYWDLEKENPIDHDYKIKLKQLFSPLKYNDDVYSDLNSNYYNIWDTELNSIYNKLINVLQEEEKELLIQSQKGWLQLNNNEIIFVYRTFRERKSGSIFGTVAYMQFGKRKLDYIRRRTLQLISYYDYLGYSYEFEYKCKYPNYHKKHEEVSEEAEKHELYFNFDTSERYQEISYNNRISKDFKVELEKLNNSPNYSTTKVLELQYEFNDIWDKELNIIYNKLLKKLDKEEKEFLVKSQVGWVKHHINEEKFFQRTFYARETGPILGSLGKIELADAHMERLKRRTLELMEYCYYLGEDFDFTYERNNNEDKGSYSIFDKAYHDYKGQTSEGTKFIITLYPKDGSLVGAFLKEKSRKSVEITGKKCEEEVKLYYKDNKGNDIEFFTGTMKTVDDIKGKIQLSESLSFNEYKKEEIKLSLQSIIFSEYNKRYASMGAKNDEVIENYAAEIQQCVINGDKEKLAKLIAFPINVHINSESRTRINSEEEFIKEYDKIMNPEFKSVIENAFTRGMFNNYKGVMFGEGLKNIWFAYLIKDDNRELKIIGINN